MIISRSWFFALVSVACFGSNANEVVENDATFWFKNDYAPVWKDSKSLNGNTLASKFVKQGTMRQLDGSVNRWQSPLDFKLFVQKNLSVGWRHSEVLSVTEIPLTPNSSTLSVKWRSQFGKKIAFSCEWYLLDKLADQWQISQQAMQRCDD